MKGSRNSRNCELQKAGVFDSKDSDSHAAQSRGIILCAVCTTESRSASVLDRVPVVASDNFNALKVMLERKLVMLAIISTHLRFLRPVVL